METVMMQRRENSVGTATGTVSSMTQGDRRLLGPIQDLGNELSYNSLFQRAERWPGHQAGGAGDMVTGLNVNKGFRGQRGLGAPWGPGLVGRRKVERLQNQPGVCVTQDTAVEKRSQHCGTAWL